MALESWGVSSCIKIFGQETCDMIQEANRKYSEQHPNEPDYDPAPDLKCLTPEQSETEAFRMMVANPDTPLETLKAQYAGRESQPEMDMESIDPIAAAFLSEQDSPHENATTPLEPGSGSDHSAIRTSFREANVQSGQPTGRAWEAHPQSEIV